MGLVVARSFPVRSRSVELAQVNIARLVAPIDSPTLAGFVERLDAINALAESSPGFVWRLQDDAGDATAIRPFDDEMMMINMSVWRSVEDLFEFVFRSDHSTVMRGRSQWFERLDERYQVLWWVPDGHRPTTTEAKERLGHLRAHGPTAHAFTFKERFAAAEAGP